MVLTAVWMLPIYGLAYPGFGRALLLLATLAAIVWCAMRWLHHRSGPAAPPADSDLVSDAVVPRGTPSRAETGKPERLSVASGRRTSVREGIVLTAVCGLTICGIAYPGFAAGLLLLATLALIAWCVVQLSQHRPAAKPAAPPAHQGGIAPVPAPPTPPRGRPGPGSGSPAPMTAAVPLPPPPTDTDAVSRVYLRPEQSPEVAPTAGTADLQ
jgi:hypothetical protein